MAKKTEKAKAAAKKPAPAKKAGAAASAKAKKPAAPASSGKKAAKPVPSKATAAKKKPVAKPTAKPAAKPAAKAPSKPVVKAKAKPVSKAQPAKKTTKPAAKPATKTVVKPAAKPVAKAPAKPTPKAVAKPAAKAVAPAAAKPADKAAVKSAPKAESKPVVAEKKVEAPVKKEAEKAVVAVPAVKNEAPAPAPAKKEAVKTVEQQIQEKSVADNGSAAKGASPKQKEELYVPKYQLPAVTEVARPMRPKPPTKKTDAPVKPVANPIYVPPAPDGKPGIKFAPIAFIEKPKEKEKPNKSEEDDMSSKTSPRLALNDSDDKKGVSVEAKLRALYGIQLIDSRIDRIHAMRGELPLEVQDLEDDVAGLEARIENVKEDLKNVTEDISGKKNGIKNSEALIKKYKEQLNNVKNNREFDSLNKEIEFQELEIQLHNKRIRESEITQKTKQDLLTATETKLNERKSDLKVKRAELDDIVSSTEKEEKILRKKSEEAKQLIESRLLAAYERIRTGAPNGMAVVPIEREASAGSFIQLPPQKQLDVAARKRVIVDEHSGRILVDAELAREEQEKMDALLAKEL